MIQNISFQQKRIFILGLGISGISAAKKLYELGAEIFIYDDKKSMNDLEILSGMAEFRHYDEIDFNKIDLILVSPGIPILYPHPHEAILKVKNFGKKITSDIELFLKLVPKARIIGITGTNGKSTTSSLVNHILNHADRNSRLGGNIGVPVFDLPINNEPDQFYVLELSSFQLDLLQEGSFFDMAILLNLSQDHLERHGDMNGYLNAKKNIFRRLKIGGKAIISLDDEYSREVSSEFAGETFASECQIKAQYFFSGNNIVLREESHYLPEGESKSRGDFGGGSDLKEGNRNRDIIASSPLLDSSPNQQSGSTLSQGDGSKKEDSALAFWLDGGKLELKINIAKFGNKQNLLSAYILSKNLGISDAIFLKSLESFVSLPHRLEYLGRIDNADYYNDSKATNAESSVNALKQLKNIILIAGGIAKAGGIEVLLPYLSDVKKVLLIGQDRELFASQLENVGFKNYSFCHSLAEAFEESRKYVLGSELQYNILLSPAAASLDMWRNYNERGEDFRNLFLAAKK